MKLARAEWNGRQTYGEVIAHRFIPIQATDLMDAIAIGRSSRSSSEIPVSEVRLLAPVPLPCNLICIGLNYRDHCEEQNVKVPERPLIFGKFSSSIVATGDEVRMPPESSQVDFEVELAVVIGSPADHVPESSALDYVCGYTVFNDISARDVQFADSQWSRGKSFPTFGPMGPWLVTSDEIPDPQSLGITLTVNGARMQNSNTGKMVFSVRELVSYASQLGLQPGDVIATGTPAGCGVFRRPQVFLKPGDGVVAEIAGIGRLENLIVQSRAAVKAYVPADSK